MAKIELIDTGRQFDAGALAELRSCIGHTLVSTEAYMPLGPDSIYKRVRLDFGTFQLDLVNQHETLVIGPEASDEEVSILSVCKSDAEIWHPTSRSLTLQMPQFHITDVLVVVDTMLLTRGSLQLNRLRLVQAVCFENSDGELLAFDRDRWSDEYLTMRKGSRISSVTRDHRGDWVAEPPYSYRFERQVQRLSLNH